MTNLELDAFIGRLNTVAEEMGDALKQYRILPPDKVLYFELSLTVFTDELDALRIKIHEENKAEIQKDPSYEDYAMYLMENMEKTVNYMDYLKGTVKELRNKSKELLFSVYNQ